MSMLLPRLVALGLLGLATSAGAATLDGLAVEVTNASEPVLCAEKDNVAVNFTSSEVRHFQIEAVHPAYMGGLQKDRWEPDWTACEDISEETSTKPHPTMTTLYEDGNVRIMGLSFAEFWRPSEVTVTIGARVERKIHLLQLLKKRDGKAIEVLVIYPGDGYWRIKPLPPEHLDWSSYGSSFLVGPVEFDQRPVVNLKDVTFDPKAMAFTLTFSQGGTGKVALKALNEERMTLDVAFDRPIAGLPFAGLRSMYVTEFNADVARIAVREEGARSWREEPIMAFRSAKATDAWMGRLVPSRHNTSAPDMMFNRFRSSPASSR
ncbi:hypothetical protein GGR34_000215 [Microvirga flocculans]|uniref:Uncharacterized protein n=1 Tax=Microvirga flocculans TaxID=217168 RepID=A0A7W6IBU2_9HYPH|nr:hypothetical protein [Microvirga flocculans]MBB4038586.1 hypothetical protein [Microvirga flocculans]